MHKQLKKSVMSVRCRGWLCSLLQNMQFGQTLHTTNLLGNLTYITPTQKVGAT